MSQYKLKDIAQDLIRNINKLKRSKDCKAVTGITKNVIKKTKRIEMATEANQNDNVPFEDGILKLLQCLKTELFIRILMMFFLSMAYI